MNASGMSSMRKCELSLRPIRGFLAAALAILGLLTSGCNHTPPAPVPQVTQTRISILQVNLRGVLDVPFGNSAENWLTRFNRIGPDLRNLRLTPDVIALQEVVAWVWCPDNWNFLKDYEPLHALIGSLEAGTGTRYRIAYMQTYVTDHQFGGGASIMGGNAHLCRAAAGLALLYNPSRIRNMLVDTPQSEASAAWSYNHNRNGPYLRRSLPCCSPRPGKESVCALIDGPTQNDKCPSTAAGLAWTAIADVAVARLSLAQRSDNTEFRIYNVHLPGEPPGLPGAWHATREVVTAIEAGQGSPCPPPDPAVAPSSDRCWIPPIIVGDFNTGETALMDWLRDFDWRGRPANDVLIHTFTGKPSSYSARANVVSHTTIQVPTAAIQGGCQDPGILWSDHCGSLTTYVIEEAR
jgi:hypothetical protein